MKMHKKCMKMKVSSLHFAAQACKIRMNRLSMSKQITLKHRPFYIKT